MLDTCNVMVTVGEDLKSISLRLDRMFPGYKMKVSNDDRDATLKLKKHWINNIRLKSTGFDDKSTTMFIDFSYPKYFYENNISLITTEQQRMEVNRELLRVVQNVSNDKTLKMHRFKYIRVDVAHQFEDVFEDYYLMFGLIYETLVESLGAENKKSRKYTQINGQEIAPRDYTTGFTYSKGEYRLNIYNKTAQSCKKGYIPGKISIIRVEQAFTHKVLKSLKTLSLEDFTMKLLKEAYSKFLEEKLWDNLNFILENKYNELTKRIENILTTSSKDIRMEIKDMQHLIVDFEVVKNIISTLDIDVSERMKYKYKSWIKKSLENTEFYSGVNVRFFNNFKRLETLLFNITTIKTKINFIQGIPKIENI